MIARIARMPWVAIVLLWVAAMLIRIAPIAFASFDGLYGQDAYAYYEYARELFAALTRLQTPPPFWWPLGYPALLSGAFLVGGVNIAAAQAITVIGGALVAPVAFLVASEAAPREFKLAAGWVAGLICVVSGQLVQSSVVIMADAPGLLWASIGAWLLLRYARTGRVWTLAIAALAVGIAVWTRWQNLIYAGVWFVTLVSIELGRQGQRHVAIGHILVALGLVALVLLPQVLVRPVVNAPLAGQAWLEGWSVTNFLRRSFDTVDGHIEYVLPVAVFYAQALVHPAYLVFLLTPLFVVGGGELVGRFKSPGQYAAILLLGWVGGMLLFLVGIPYENFRFALGLFLPAAVVTGIGAGWLWWRWRNSWWRYALVGWVALALLVMLAWEPRVLAPVLELKARELAQVRWLESRLPEGATLWTMGLDGAVKAYTPLRVENIWERSEAELRGNSSNYLYVDVGNLETQWRERQPYGLFRALRAENALQMQGEYAGWTLYIVE